MEWSWKERNSKEELKLGWIRKKHNRQKAMLNVKWFHGWKDVLKDMRKLSLKMQDELWWKKREGSSGWMHVVNWCWIKTKLYLRAQILQYQVLYRWKWVLYRTFFLVSLHTLTDVVLSVPRLAGRDLPGAFQMRL